ncbi:MAG: hypothetical protein U0Y82_01145 [Thermoleophilia bacterium]
MGLTHIGRRRRVAALAATGACIAVGAGTAGAATKPANVVCRGNQPQYGYGPAYGTDDGSYGVGSGAVTSRGNPSHITLTKKQLLINQRISQAAIVRIRAVQQWLDDGVTARDICGGALGPEDFSGITSDNGAPPTTRPAPDPRPLVLTEPPAGDRGSVQLSRGQMLINQRISQTAVRRVNGLVTRMRSGLTGGDVKDGTLSVGDLRQAMRITAVSPVAAPPASVTSIAVGVPGNPARVTLSKKQLLINQRISQAAVRRVNAVILHLHAGLNGNDFRNGSLTGADLAPQTVTPATTTP